MIQALALVLSAWSWASSVSAPAFSGGTVSQPTTFAQGVTVGQSPATVLGVTLTNTPSFSAPRVYVSSPSGAVALSSWRFAPTGAGASIDRFVQVYQSAPGYKSSLISFLDDASGNSWTMDLISTTAWNVYGSFGINAQQDPSGSWQNGGDGFAEISNDEGTNVGDNGIWDEGVCGVQGGGHGCPANHYFIFNAVTGAEVLDIDPATPTGAVGISAAGVEASSFTGSGYTLNNFIVDGASASATSTTLGVTSQVFLATETVSGMRGGRWVKGIYKIRVVNGSVTSTYTTHLYINGLENTTFKCKAQITGIGQTSLITCPWFETSSSAGTVTYAVSIDATSVTGSPVVSNVVIMSEEH